MIYMGLKDQDETSRVGTKWLPDEDAKLMEEIANNLSYDAIALEHKRTSVGIQSRVISQIIYPIFRTGNKTLEELSREYKIDMTMLEKYINNLKSKNKNNTDTNTENQQKPKIKRKEAYEKIMSFEDKFFVLEQKLDYIIRTITN
jgi:hypothetical protein